MDNDDGRSTNNWSQGLSNSHTNIVPGLFYAIRREYYCAMVKLNNYGVTLLQQGQYQQGKDAFHRAIVVANHGLKVLNKHSINNLFCTATAPTFSTEMPPAHSHNRGQHDSSTNATTSKIRGASSDDGKKEYVASEDVTTGIAPSSDTRVSVLPNDDDIKYVRKILQEFECRNCVHYHLQDDFGVSAKEGKDDAKIKVRAHCLFGAMTSMISQRYSQQQQQQHALASDATAAVCQDQNHASAVVASDAALYVAEVIKIEVDGPLEEYIERNDFDYGIESAIVLHNIGTSILCLDLSSLRMTLPLTLSLSNNPDFMRTLASSIASFRLALSVIHDLGLTSVFRQQWQYKESLDRIIHLLNVEVVILDALVPLLHFFSCNNKSNKNITNLNQEYLECKAKQKSVTQILTELYHRFQIFSNVQGCLGAAMA